MFTKIFVDTCVALMLCTNPQTVEKCDFSSGKNCTIEEKAQFDQAFEDYTNAVLDGKLDIGGKDLIYFDPSVTDYFLQSTHISDWASPTNDGWRLHTPEIWTYESRLKLDK